MQTPPRTPPAKNDEASSDTPVESPAQVAVEEDAQDAEALDDAVDALVDDLRELQEILIQSGEALAEKEAAAEAESDKEDAESEGAASEGAEDADSPQNAFTDLFNKNVTALASAQDAPTRFTLTSALLQQVNLVVVPVREQRAAELAELGEEEMVDPAVAIHRQLSSLWKPSSVISSLIIFGLLAAATLSFLGLSVVKRRNNWKNLLRSHSCAHLTLVAVAMSSFSAIAIVTRQHFGDGTEGWALALIGDIIVYLWPVWCLWFSCCAPIFTPPVRYARANLIQHSLAMPMVIACSSPCARVVTTRLIRRRPNAALVCI